jgi:hypothetical protein
LSQNQFRYAYGRSANPQNIKNLIIQLPSKNNKPDWDFMENYIKSIPYGDLV